MFFKSFFEPVPEPLWLRGGRKRSRSRRPRLEADARMVRFNKISYNGNSKPIGLFLINSGFDDNYCEGCVEW